MIAFDMPTEQLDTSEKYHTELACFRQQQPGTFKNASMVMIGGRLDEPVAELQLGHWDAIRQFLKLAAMKQPLQRMSKIQGVLNVFNGFFAGVGFVCKQTYYGMGWGWNKLFGGPKKISDESDDDDNDSSKQT